MIRQTDLIHPQWPAPGHIRAIGTTRYGGVSGTPWHSLNLATHVSDDPRNVQQNRKNLSSFLDFPYEPVWLEQRHGCDVAVADAYRHQPCDASVTCREKVICAVLTADCLPVLFTDYSGTIVAVAHAGWRGLAAGILENTVNKMSVPASKILVWMGPAIGPKNFAVGKDVYQVFTDFSGEADKAFTAVDDGRWLCDIYLLARQRLNAIGVTGIYGGGHCTYEEEDNFYSFRRDGITGRMASLIWINHDTAAP